jgi:SAM-dependent methyltransferase
MKICLSCDSTFQVKDNTCSQCGNVIQVVDGFESYAPEMARGGGGFKSDYFSILARLEANNFWFKSRNRIIVWALKKYTKNFRSMLEIGCGTGFVLSHLVTKFPHANFSGSEIFAKGLDYAATRLPVANLMQMDARKIPYIKEFDVIGAFDVLEHIKEDELVLIQIHKALNENGLMVITVPQHQWLWSKADEYAFHERRYTAKELKLKITDAGFDVLKSTSFISFLLPLMIISRLFSKHRKDYEPSAELTLNPAINFILEKILMVEFLLIKLGLNLSLGGSRLVIAKKRSLN